MISTKIIFVSCWSLLLVFSSVYAIYDPNDGVKTKTFRRGQGPSEPIVMHHQYSQVSSNRPQESGYSQSQFDARQGRTSYTNEAENYVAQYGSECPPNATGQYPYILNCRQFLNCWKGRGYIQSCAPGTVFNPDTRECDNPEKVICLNYRSESNPNNHFARLQQVQTKSYSDSPSPTSSHPPRNIGDDVQCAPGSSGVQPHPFDCAKFLNCANGITYIQVCGPGTVFNSVSLVCDFPYNVDCSSRSGGPSGSQGADSTNDYGQQHHTQGHYGGGFHNHRHHSWPSSSQGTTGSTSSTDNINGRDSTFAGLSPGYGSSATTPSTSKHQYDQSGSGSSSFSHDQIAQASQSRNYDQESSRTYHQIQNYPHRHHYHHHRPGGYRRHFQSQSGQQGLEYSTTSQGEQANLNEGTQHHYYDSFENSGENTTEQKTYQGGARYRHHHHFHHHRHHPGCNHTHHQHQHHHHHHRHSWNHHNHTFHHSREFHRNHPEIHNPFATNDLGESETPDKREGHIDTRIDNRDDSAGGTYPELDADKPACQFDCKNGKCISEYQVCDGVNNCGNRLDEKQCDHIGYEVRLSSDEGKANMGRVEVKGTIY